MKRRLAAVMAVIITSAQLLPCAVSAEEAAIDSAAVSVSVSEDNKTSEETKTSEEDKMKDALTLVKSRIDIPEEYSNFSYSSGVENGVTRYNFTWKDPSGNEAYTVEVKGDIIRRFSSPQRTYNFNNKPSLAAHDSDFYVNKAMSWLCRVNPSMKGFLKSSDVNLSITSWAVNVSFQRQYENIPINGNNFHLSLNKQTGDVVSFYGAWWQDAEFENPAYVLSQEAIKEIYCKEVSIKPWYRVYYDSETGKKRTNIVYTPLNSFNYNALTGEHSSMNDDYEKYMDTDRYATPTASVYEEDFVEEECDDVDAGAGIDNPATGVQLSEDELAAAAEINTFLTSEQFRELMIKDPFMGITDKYIADNFRISRDENAECGYSIQCNMRINNKTESRSVNITADAKSGKVMSFYTYNNEGKTNINVKKANSLANKALKYYFGDIADEYRADTENTAPISTDGKNKITNRCMRYNRYVNNIQVTNNCITICVNSAGQVTSISSYHDKDVDFGDGLIVNKETALKLVCQQQDMTLEYDGFTDLASVPHTYLHYSMDNWSLNAVNGKLCNYNGEPIVKAAEIKGCPYTDIASSPYKKEIETLYLHGVKIYSGDKFSPGEKMTYGELMNLLEIISGYGYEPMPLSERMTANGSVTADSSYFTRMELAKEFTRVAGVDSCAKYPGIFRSPFTDVKENDKNLGYAALAYGMGAISCGKDGKFYPNAYVTREYAFHCAYNYLKNNSEG
ncbi:MAG: S-layer homology domain-containing protein [Oscillospiraceae bacterium]|nr:S-layer homology domain-containing protein [Oscillospiraceae bacterium]